MGLLNNLDIFFYTKILTKSRIRKTLENFNQSFPEEFLSTKSIPRLRTHHCYIDRENRLAFEIYGISGLTIYVFSSENAVFSYSDNKLQCSSLLIEVYNKETGFKLKGWWDKKIPNSVYFLVTRKRNLTEKKSITETINYENALNKANSCNPDNFEETKEDGMIL